MSEVLLYGGTTEGRVLAKRLSEAGITVDVRVATEYGSLVMPDLPGVTVTVGRLEVQEMRILAASGFRAVVDATHPYAAEVSENIRKSLEGRRLPLFRLKRQEERWETEGEVSYFENNARCAETLMHTEGNILLTTGSKELPEYCCDEKLRKRLVVRILPGQENLTRCRELGIGMDHIIAMQGPFTTEMNTAIIHQFAIEHLVTKESGAGSGFAEKLEAAGRTGVHSYVIGKPVRETGMSFGETAKALSALFGKTVEGETRVKISLIGIGMGSDTLTVAARRALREADLVFGAPRMLEELSGDREQYPYYQAEKILPILEKKREQFSEGELRAAVLFSGDSGFYSGCEKIKEKLIKNGFDDITIHPGISSVSYLSAKAGVPWQDAALCSIHGKTAKEWRPLLLDAVMHHQNTFLLLSEGSQVSEVGTFLAEAGFGDCRLFCGFRLSYPTEKILCLPASNAGNLLETGLCTCLIQNKASRSARAVPGIPDERFLRTGVPMTKEEIREVSLCKLGLRESSIVYDIGSGTGSVTVECALRVPKGWVYAIECKEEALAILQRNLEHFSLYNVQTVPGTAPSALAPLPPPTHVFIGGSGGHLEEILREVWKKNPKARVVITAVSLETEAQIANLLTDLEGYEGRKLVSEMIRLQVSRGHQAGKYHLMKAENPVMIFCMELADE